jgi:hypothetical protein
MWSTLAGGHLMKVVNLIGFTVQTLVTQFLQIQMPGMFTLGKHLDGFTTSKLKTICFCHENIGSSI